MEQIIEDTKIAGSAVVTFTLDYFQLFNQLITLGINICIFIYVAHRAYFVLKKIFVEDNND